MEAVQDGEFCGHIDTSGLCHSERLVIEAADVLSPPQWLLQSVELPRRRVFAFRPSDR